ncbi:MAG: DUF3047 domain-containing protein [Methyloprofundus sp.]|nr:DUF3047 domain-containing protein [Methyloprofundus sp.]
MVLGIVIAFFLSFSSWAFATPIIIDNFTQDDLSHWQKKSFVGETEYKVTDLGLRATSHSSASSLYKEIHIDLEKTPYLNWSWRIDKKLNIANEEIKQGDDFSARVYIIFKTGWGFWQTKSLTYVWASQAEKFQAWKSPYAGKSVMEIALRSKNDKLAYWYTEKRNILVDINKHFGKKIRYIDAVAIMTDTDNTGGSALSYYKKIYFSEH